MVATHVLRFRDERQAARFVWRLHHELRDVASLRDGATVYVLDSLGQGRRITELARESGAVAF